jgi:hypothetical protein
MYQTEFCPKGLRYKEFAILSLPTSSSNERPALITASSARIPGAAAVESKKYTQATYKGKEESMKTFFIWFYVESL